MRDLIFQQLLRCCEPYPLPVRWRQVGSGVECYRPPCDGAAAVAQLVDMFGEQALLAAGVVSRTADGLMLSPALADPASVLVVLRDSADVPPHDIMTAAGLLRSETPSILEYLAVVTNAQLARSDNFVFMGFTIDDVVALRSVGFAAAIAAGSAAYTADDLRQLNEECRWDRVSDSTSSSTDSGEPECDGDGQQEPGSDESVDADLVSSEVPSDDPPEPVVSTVVPGTRHRGLSFVFVDCSLATFNYNTPPALPPLVSLLANAEHYLELDLSSIGVWRPSAEAQNKLQCLLALGDQDSVRAAILDSVTESTRSLDGFLRPGVNDERPRDFAAAAAQMSRLIQEHPRQLGCAESYSSALDQWLELLERDVIAPAIAQALRSDPLSRPRVLAIAELSSLLHRQALVAQRELAAALLGHPDAGSSPALDRVLKIADQLNHALRGL